MNIYLDDCRPAPDGYQLVKSAAECIAALKTGRVVRLSLDHDLGDACGICWALLDGRSQCVSRTCFDNCTCGCHQTGYDVCLWMAEYGMWSEQLPAVHSANPEGSRRMRGVIDRYWPGRPFLAIGGWIGNAPHSEGAVWDNYVNGRWFKNNT